MLSLPYAVFFYGGTLLVLLMIAFTLGAICEHRRHRLELASRLQVVNRDEQHRVDVESYRLGKKHGYYKATCERRKAPVRLDVDLE